MIKKKTLNRGIRKKVTLVLIGRAGILFLLHKKEVLISIFTIFRFTMAISRSMPMFMVLAWIYSVSMIVKGIVYEKEKRLKEVMKAMGLGNAVHWLAWFITCLVMMVISTLLLLVILSVRTMLFFRFLLIYSVNKLNYSGILEIRIDI